MTLLPLATRVEALDGPDREVDYAVRVALGYPAKPWNYTASLDAVVALITEKLPGWHWRVQGGNPDTGAYMMSGKPSALLLRHVEGGRFVRIPDNWSGAATPALALLAAALRALASQPDSDRAEKENRK